MEFQDRLKAGEVLVPKTERLVAPTSYSKILEYTSKIQETARLNSCFTANTKDTLGVTILSDKESIAAFCLAPKESKIDTPLNHNWHRAILRKSLESNTFRENLIVKPIGVSLLGSGPIKYLGLILVSEELELERRAFVDCISTLSPNYQPRKHRFQVSLGLVNKGFGHVINTAKTLLDIEEIELNRGRIRKNMPRKLLDPKIVNTYLNI